MFQLSKSHRVVTKGWLSMTSTLDRLTWWPVNHTCSTKANAATEFCQTVQHTPWDNPNRGSGTPCQCVDPWVQGPWDRLAGIWGCCVGGKPLWCPEVWGFFWLSSTDRWCRGGSDWSFEASGHLSLVLAGYCSACTSGRTSVGSHSTSPYRLQRFQFVVSRLSIFAGLPKTMDRSNVKLGEGFGSQKSGCLHLPSGRKEAKGTLTRRSEPNWPHPQCKRQYIQTTHYENWNSPVSITCIVILTYFVL